MQVPGDSETSLRSETGPGGEGGPGDSTLQLKAELIEAVSPFGLTRRERPDADAHSGIQARIECLAQLNPNPDLRESFTLLGGLWDCIYTTSKYVLQLDNLPGLRLVGVLQSVHIDTSGDSGHYFNVGELVGGSRVRLACGEYAAIQSSSDKPHRMNVRYENFYFAHRFFRAYEGAQALCDKLNRNALNGAFRIPFGKEAYQDIVYLDDDMRLVLGSEGGIFVLVRRTPSAVTPPA